MKVLMLSADPLILQENSSVRARMREYAQVCDELHIIVLCTRGSGVETHENKLHIYPTNSFAKIFRYRAAYKIAAQIIKDRSLKSEDTLITVQDPFELGLIGVWLKKKFGLRLQVQVHTDFASKYFATQSRINFLRTALASYIVRIADGVRVVSERIANYVRVMNSNTVVLPVFVDVEAIRNTPMAVDLRIKYPAYNFFVVMVSRLTPEKRVLMARDIFKEIHEAHPEVCLVIVGDGPERTWLTGYDFIKLEGWARDTASYFKSADIFLNTSLYEGYGRTLIEAAAAGARIITTDVGIAPEVVVSGKNGFIVPVEDRAALKKTLLDVIEGEVTLQPSVVEAQSKEEYLAAYKESWERCF